MSVRLLGQRITFHPAQHVAMVTIFRQSDGRSIEIVASALEASSDGVAVLRPLHGVPSPGFVDQREFMMTPGIAAPYVNRLPLLREIDLADLPIDFRSSSASGKVAFELRKGDAYFVTVVGESILSGLVVAE